MNLTFASQASALFSTGMEKSGDMYINCFNSSILMQMIRNMNIVILAFLLILTGCFGMFGNDEDDSVEAQTTDVTATLTAQDIADAMILASNSPPKISVKTFDWSDETLGESNGFPKSNWVHAGVFACLEDPEDLTGADGTHIGYTLEEQRESVAENLEDDRHLANLVELGDCVLYFDFVSVDPDGDAMTKGIDTDFDGIIDIPITPNEGMVMAAVDNSTNKDLFGGFLTSQCEQIDVAFIAVDEHGASTAEFMHFLGIDSCEEDDDYGGELMLYIFNGYDAPDRTLADGSTDKGAVIMTMAVGNDISWAEITIKASVDGAASVTVPPCDASTEINCWYSADSDTLNWNFGEAITVDTDCAGTCVVEITILNSREGVTLDVSTIDIE